MILFWIFYWLGVFGLIFPTVRLPFVNLSYSDLFIFCALALWLWEYLRHQGRAGWGFPLHSLWAPAVLILIGGLGSSIGAVSPTASASITVKTVFVLTLWVSMSMVVVRRGGLEATLAIFLFAVTLSAGVGVFDRLTSSHWGDLISGNRVIFYERTIGTFGHPNDLGFITSVAMPLVLALMLREWHTRQRVVRAILFAGVFGLMTFALFYSGSVAGWVSVLVSTSVFILLWLWRANNWQRIVVVLVVLALMGVGAFIFSDPERQEDLGFLLNFNLNRASNITGPGRTELVDEALGVITRNPFIGVGLDQSGTGGLGAEELATSAPIHNTLIAGWLGGGMFFFVGLLGCYAIVLITALRALRWGFREADWLVVGLGACALGWMLFDQTQPHLSQRYPWLIVAFLFGLGFGFGWTDISDETVRSAHVASAVPAEAGAGQ